MEGGWRGRAPSRPGSAARRPGVEADSARRLACRLARWSSSGEGTVERHGFLGFRGLGRRGRGWVGAVDPGSEVADGWKGIGGGGAGGHVRRDAEGAG